MAGIGELRLTTSLRWFLFVGGLRGGQFSDHVERRCQIAFIGHPVGDKCNTKVHLWIERRAGRDVNRCLGAKDRQDFRKPREAWVFLVLQHLLKVVLSNGGFGAKGAQAAPVILDDPLKPFPPVG